jgi:hypothetical protein
VSTCALSLIILKKRKKEKTQKTKKTEKAENRRVFDEKRAKSQKWAFYSREFGNGQIPKKDFHASRFSHRMTQLD